MTTPSPVDVAALLAAMRDNGCEACAIEVSSHVAGPEAGRCGSLRGGGLHQSHRRPPGLPRDDGKLRDAKANSSRCFSPDAAAIVNARDAAADAWFATPSPASAASASISWPTIGQPMSDHGRRNHVHAAHPLRTAPVNMKLIGRHNVENALTAAASVAEAFGLSPARSPRGSPQLSGAPGRLQVVDAGQPFAVLVDYAHTDDALANVLSALAAADARKAPRAVSAVAAIATAPSGRGWPGLPRKWPMPSTSPATTLAPRIRGEIIDGDPRRLSTNRPSRVWNPTVAGPSARSIGDAQTGDVVLLAGKGHENYQIIGTTKHHFDDVEEAMKVLR